jgi:hypothetical protein
MFNYRRPDLVYFPVRLAPSAPNVFVGCRGEHWSECVVIR